MAKGNYGVTSLGGSGGPGAGEAQGTSNGKGSVSLSAFQAIADDNVIDFLSELNSTVSVPGTRDSVAQKLISTLGLNDKPQVVSDSELDTIIKQNNTPEFFHTMKASEFGSTDLNEGQEISAVDVQKATMYGEVNVLSSGIYGEGAYFATDYGDSARYGKIGESIDKSAVIRATLSPDARVIEYSDLLSSVEPMMARHTAMQKELDDRLEAMQRSGKDDLFNPDYINLMNRQNELNKVKAGLINAAALRSGYNVIRESFAATGHEGQVVDYYNVIDRKALIISSNIRPTPAGKVYSWKDNLDSDDKK